MKIFKPEDFAIFNEVDRDWITRKAQSIFEQYCRENGKVVYSRGEMVWTVPNNNGDTHQAILICVEPIEKPDTAESLLSELLEIENSFPVDSSLELGKLTQKKISALHRAKKLLGQ